jgi:hypothetical protein
MKDPAYAAAYRAKRKKTARRRGLKARYGLTVQDYNALIKVQGGVCAICKEPPRGQHLSVDHDHKTGQIRGLLCNECNSGLGKFKDSISLMAEGIKYLRENE